MQLLVFFMMKIKIQIPLSFAVTIELYKKERGNISEIKNHIK